MGRVGLGKQVIGGWGCHDETGFTPAEAEIHRARGEVAGDFGCRRRQRIQKDKPHCRFQRRGEPFGQRLGVFPASFGGYRQLMAESVDIRRKIHGTIMTPLWRHRKAYLALTGAE